MLCHVSKTHSIMVVCTKAGRRINGTVDQFYTLAIAWPWKRGVILDCCACSRAVVNRLMT